MQRLRFVWSVVLIGGLSVPTVAQEIEKAAQTLTMQQAIERALANYPAVQIQRFAIEQAKGLKTTTGLLPNPVISYYNESLKSGTLESGEQIITGALPLSFIWSRWSGAKAASAQVEAEMLTLANVERLLKYEVQKAYIEAHFAAQSYAAWQETAEAFRQAAQVSRVRLAGGDMAGYEQQRIAIENLRYQKAEAEAIAKVINSRRQLAFLLDPAKNDILIETSSNFPAAIPEISEDGLRSQAMKNRPDLQAARAIVQNREAALSMAKWQRLPDASVTAGYKKTVEDFDGAVVQVNIGIPLFDRNQGEIRSARAALDKQALAADFLAKQVALEVRQAYEKHEIYRRLIERFQHEQGQGLEQLLEIAQYSYSEGEMELIELLDGVRAYIELVQTKHDLFLNYQLSLFELERASSTSIIN